MSQRQKEMEDELCRALWVATDRLMGNLCIHRDRAKSITLEQYAASLTMFNNIFTTRVIFSVVVDMDLHFHYEDLISRMAIEGGEG